MGRWTRFICAAGGFALIGPIGAVLGYVIGKNIDDVSHDRRSESYSNDEEYIYANRGNLLFTNILGFMAAIVKADGVVKKSEIKTVMFLLHKMYDLDSVDMSMARNAFMEMLSVRLNIRELSDSFNRYADKPMKLTLVATLFQVSYADGDLSAAEERMINSIGKYLRISDYEMRSIKAGCGYNERTRTTYSSKEELEKAYDILGVSDSFSEDEIKKKYRTLVKEHHPDQYQSINKVAADAASKKMAQINQAYQTVRNARRI